MHIDGWNYYNHAAIPTTAPCEKTNLLPIENKSIWKLNGKHPLLARWTSEFDCGYETNWWYVVKDSSFDISGLKAKRRYEINKGIKYFKVVEINPANYAEELYGVQVAAFSGYPRKYRPKMDKQRFLGGLAKWESYCVMGAFFRETNELCGYALLAKESESYVDFKVLKTNPRYEKYSVNAALVEGVLRQFGTFLAHKGYLCDGARSINHDTAFQDYLEKYFGFRKAFCKLHIEYNPKFKWMIKILFHIRRFLLIFDGIGIVHQVNAVLQMEEICRGKET